MSSVPQVGRSPRSPGLKGSASSGPRPLLPASVSTGFHGFRATDQNWKDPRGTLEFWGFVSDHRSAKAEGRLQSLERGWAPLGPCGQGGTAALRPPASPGSRTGAVPARRGFCSPRAGVDPAGQRPNLSRRHSRSENRRGLRARWTSRCPFSGLRGTNTGWDPGWPAELGGLQAPV